MHLHTGDRVGSYEIVSLLGAGGMGEVYRARDSRLGRAVALKFLLEEGSTDRPALDRFAREARAASSLNHPNIVTVYDIGETQAGRFIAMELVEGVTVRALGRERPSVEVVLNVALQAAKALAAAHAAGIVHRDIKPDNLMVRDDGYLKMLDFGLARITSETPDSMSAPTHTELTEAGTVLGTVRYMSPEQARAEAITIATDIFSLGVVLYELATGEHPFAAGSRIGVMSAILTQRPVPPTRLNAELPAAFEGLLLEMLEKDPRLRPSALTIQTHLSALAVGAEPQRVAASVVSTSRRPLIGREAELAELAASFESATTQRGLMHAVVAEAGFGKSTFVESFLQTVAWGRGPCRIGRGRCSERLAAAEAYLPVFEALESLLRGESGDAVARAMRLLAPEWYVQLQPPSPLSGSGAKSGAETRVGSSEHMKRQLVALLEELTRSAPLVLFLDDVHWADASTIDLLAYLCDRFDAIRMLLIVAYRPSDLLLNRHPFIDVKLNLQSRGVCRETALGPFGAQDLARYLATTYPRHQFPDEFVSLLHQRTEGTPLFVVDLMRQLVDRGVIVHRDGAWVLAQSVRSVESEIPESIRSVIQRTIDRLDEADRRLLVAASVQGAEFDSAVVARAIQMDSEEVEERLEKLERVYALVRLVDERELAGRMPSLRYAFVHALYQNALHATVRATRRASLSGAVAAALLEYYGEAPAVASQLAVLFEAARSFDKAATFFLAAARNAMRVYAAKEAVALARRGLEVIKPLADTPERARIELQLQVTLGAPLTGLVGYAAPEVEKAYSRARDLCARLGDTPTLLPVLHGLYRFYIVRGRLHTARDIVEQLVKAAEATGNRDQMFVARAAMGAPLVHLAELDAAVEHLGRAIESSDVLRSAADRLLLGGAEPGMAARLWMAVALWLLGRPDEALEKNREALEIGERLQHPFGLAYAHNLTAWLHQYRGDVDLVLHHAELSIQISRDHDFAQWLALGVMYRAWALVGRSDASDAMSQLAHGLESFRRTGAELNLPHFLSLLADAHLRAGDAAVGLDVIRQALEIAAANDDRCWEPELHRLQGALLEKSAAPGDMAVAERAEAAYAIALSVADRQKSRSLELRAAVSMAGLLDRRGRRADGRRILEGVVEKFPERVRTSELEAARAWLAAGSSTGTPVP